jgi:hypothetical protein
VGKHSGVFSPRPSNSGAGAEPFGWRIRNRSSVPIFAFLAAAAFLALSVIAPNPEALAAVGTEPAPSTGGQSLAVAPDVVPGGQPANGEPVALIVRDSYTVTKKIVRAVAPAAGIPDPGTAQAIGYELVMARGWGDDQFSCLVALFNKESHWNVYAGNPVSGAYGIPQALPGSKMASAGADWQTNPRTQITWGLNYIAGRYITPCGAWAASQAKGWY